MKFSQWRSKDLTLSLLARGGRPSLFGILLLAPPSTNNRTMASLSWLTAKCKAVSFHFVCRFVFALHSYTRNRASSRSFVIAAWINAVRPLWSCTFTFEKYFRASGLYTSDCWAWAARKNGVHPVTSRTLIPPGKSKLSSKNSTDLKYPSAQASNNSLRGTIDSSNKQPFFYPISKCSYSPPSSSSLLF